mgnify:FL=1
MKKIVKELELNLNKLEGLNKYIDQNMLAQVNEAVKHFTKRKRATEDDFDERYFYSFNLLTLFQQKNKNPEVKVEIIYRDREVLDYIKLYR